MHIINNKNYLSLLFVLMLIFNVQEVNAQLLPSAYDPAIKINYVRTWDVTAPTTDASTILNKPVTDVKMSTQYIDGLGRPLQTVMHKGSLETVSGTFTDLVAPVLYDELGRETYKYLAFPASTVADGSFKFNPFQQQLTLCNLNI